MQQKLMHSSFMNQGFIMEGSYIIILITTGIAAFFIVLGLMNGYNLDEIKAMLGKDKNIKTTS
jgi:hypothetical protein